MTDSAQMLPEAWRGDGLTSAVEGLLSLRQFGLVTRLLAIEGVTGAAAHWAHVGSALMNLDMHDSSMVPGEPTVDASLKERLGEVRWPNSPDALPRGPLSDLAPTYRLMLEVLAVHRLRGETSTELAILHLMAEYLPLLAWGAVTGDAGDPSRLRNLLAGPGARWHSDTCPLNRAERGGFAAAVHGEAWDVYLRDRHSRISSALAVCGGVPNPVLSDSSSRVCRRQCSVMDGVDGIAWRMTLARRFRDSSVLQLRHDAPVGHFFSVPAESEIEHAWHETWEGLIADGDETPAGENPLRGMQPQGAMECLANLLGYVAGDHGPMQPATLVADVAAVVRREIAAL